MRLLHVQVPDEQRDSVGGVLEERDIDYTVFDTEDGTLVEFPLPTDGVGDVTSALEEAEIDTGSYTVIGTAETRACWWTPRRSWWVRWSSRPSSVPFLPPGLAR